MARAAAGPPGPLPDDSPSEDRRRRRARLSNRSPAPNPAALRRLTSTRSLPAPQGLLLRVQSRAAPAECCWLDGVKASLTWNSSVRPSGCCAMLRPGALPPALTSEAHPPLITPPVHAAGTRRPDVLNVWNWGSSCSSAAPEEQDRRDLTVTLRAIATSHRLNPAARGGGPSSPGALLFRLSFLCIIVSVGRERSLARLAFERSRLGAPLLGSRCCSAAILSPVDGSYHRGSFLPSSCRSAPTSGWTWAGI